MLRGLLVVLVGLLLVRVDEGWWLGLEVLGYVLVLLLGLLRLLILLLSN